MNAVWKRVVIGLAILGLVLGTTFVSADLARAGSNGQMLRMGNACSNPAMLTWVKVYGYNQNNRYTTWEARPNSATVLTSGYWWVGNATMEWRTNRDGYLHRTSVYVPKQYERDDYRVLLDRWGC